MALGVSNVKDTNNENNNYYSSLSYDDLIKEYNRIVAEKNKLDWAYYYVCTEIEARRKKALEQQTGGLQASDGGFRGASQFQKRTDEIVRKQLNPDNKNHS